jgi:cell division septation protein DedD
VVAAEKKQPAVEVKRSQSPQDGEKKLADAKKAGEKGGIPAFVPSPKRTVRKEPAPAGDAAGSAQWTVLVGNYVLEEALATDLASVRKAGLHAYVVSGPLKKSHMSRLLLAEFPERAAAQAELVKLKRYTSDAFILDSAGKHTVFAGSYLLDARAATEIERLAAVGFSLTMKRVEVAIPSKNLTAGSYADQNQAEDTIKKLRAAGIKATLSH